MVFDAVDAIHANSPFSSDPEVMAQSLRAMVEAGAFGAWRPAAFDDPTPVDGFEVVERYACADLAAAFVLSQHPMFVETALSSSNARLIADVEPLIRGEGISAVGFSDMRRGQSPDVTIGADAITLTGDVSRISGMPWASWLLIGAIDRARTPGEVIFAFVELDPSTSARISTGPREDAGELTGADTRTVHLDAVRVPAHRVIRRGSHPRWITDDHDRIVNAKPFHYGYGERLLSFVASFGAADRADTLRGRLAANRAEARALQATASPDRLPRERLLLRLRSFGVVRDIADAYAETYVSGTGAPTPELVTKTVRVLEFPATNRYIQGQARRFFADRHMRAEDMPEFDAAELLASV